MPADLMLVRVLRALVEVAGYFVLAQGLLYVFSGSRRERNPIYHLFQVLTQPVYKLTRLLTPKLIADQHIPFIAFAMLFWLWIALAVVKRELCALHQIQCGF